MTEITQADRDAAAMWAKHNGRHQQAANIRRGTADSTYLPKLFARHRIAARNAALEEAAIACEKFMADCLDDPDIQKIWPRIKAENLIRAEAIRALMTKEPK